MKRYLTRVLRSSRAREPHCGLARLRLLPLFGTLIAYATMSMQAANAANTEVEMYKLYAHTKLLDDKQYRCVVKLWRAESNWSPVADNKRSTAYGIPQLLKMTERNPYKQIDLGLKYIDHRYGSPCKALAHHEKKGHY